MNKKIVSLLMAAALTTGMGGYGTVAYFTDKAEVNDQISITMGTLDVEAEFINAWTVKGDTESSVEGSKFINVRPGDQFERKIKVKNAGSLMADTVIQLNDVFENKNLIVKLTLDSGENMMEIASGKKFISPWMKSGQENIFKVSITVSDEMTAGQVEQIFNSIEAKDLVTVTAKQQVAK